MYLVKVVVLNLSKEHSKVMTLTHFTISSFLDFFRGHLLKLFQRDELITHITARHINPVLVLYCGR